jgi:Rrf2 family iron-sulfur cluster assembly transcriptional regulator
MQLSTRGRYAVMAMVELAARSCRDAVSPCGPVTLHEIATSQQLSLCYLEQLFGGLRRAGLVTSARGPSGGYRLARPAGQISIGEVVGAVDETLRAARCTPGSGGCMQGADGAMTMCQTHELWAELSRQITLFLDGITLADVLAGRVIGRAAQPEPVEQPARLRQPA